MRLPSLLSIAAALFAAAPVYAAPPPCQPVTFEGKRYTVCEADPRRHFIRTFWMRPDGKPYGTLSTLPATLGASGGKLLFATNAGMFHPTYKPVGLYIEDGREYVAVNTKAGLGNFHMKPNGIFYVSGETAGIAETSAYLRRKPKAGSATQSGPMLVTGGHLHPRFSREGPSLKVRNGAGIHSGGGVVFAISEEPVSFGSFARLFRDKYKCRDALFLDGTISALYVPAAGRKGNFLPLGPMIGVFERAGLGND
jgi:uncharacterized protein YigE (DUF2233 family)